MNLILTRFRDTRVRFLWFFDFFKQIIIESSHDIDEYKHVIERIETFNNAIKLLEVLQQFENYLIGKYA